jgi:type VI secretion system protein ImpF
MTEGPIRLSVLDRLAMDEADNADPATVYRASVARNLEWILNTRQVIEPAPDAFPEVQRSVYHFGTPDLASESADSDASRLAVARRIASAIEMFEPRLRDVRVTVRSGRGERVHGVRFGIEGTLIVDQGPERLELDTVLEPSSGRMAITEYRNA